MIAHSSSNEPNADGHVRDEKQQTSSVHQSKNGPLISSIVTRELAMGTIERCPVAVYRNSAHVPVAFLRKLSGNGYINRASDT